MNMHVSTAARSAGVCHLPSILNGDNEHRQETVAGRDKMRKIRVISVTSGKGGVGKSNVVANLALAMTRMGSKVLIIDADLGLGNINLLLGQGYKNDLYFFCETGPVDTTVLAGHSTNPTVVDWDKNKIPDLLIGAEDGYFYYLKNQIASLAHAIQWDRV